MALALDDVPLFLSVAEVSRLLRRHPRTLRNWRVEQRGPRAVRLEGYWAYPRADFEAYLSSLTAEMVEALPAEGVSA
jgi:Helix-turn-helix domain